MFTHRFNLNWNNNTPNKQFFGLHKLIQFIYHNHLTENKEYKMVEIGAYMGESTMMFASSNLFKEIYTIEPFKNVGGKIEEFNGENDYNWDTIYNEFQINTRFFNNITLHKDFSYNVADKFEDNSMDFIYIDGDHSYDAVKQDLEMYLPKLKDNGVIGGHDYLEKNKYYKQNTIRAVNEVVGKPDKVFVDSSWIKQLNHFYG
jgi:predicted O-methyltransferase YrrM